MCAYKTDNYISDESRIITSDDVFDFMLNLRSMNEGIDSQREEFVDIKRWTELENVRTYYNFFKEHEREFD